LPADACLRNVGLAVRADEAGHRDANHHFADQLDDRHAAAQGEGR
jgi:ubiquinol oxidase